MNQEDKFVKLAGLALVLGRHFMSRGVFVSFRAGPKKDLFIDWDSDDYDAIMHAMRTVRYNRHKPKENTSD